MTVSYFVICSLVTYFNRNFYLIYGILWNKVFLL